MGKFGSGQIAPIVILGVAALGLFISCIVYPCARSLNRRGRLPRMNFNLLEQANPPTITGTNKSVNISGSDSRTYDNDLGLAIERSLKTTTIEGNPGNNNLSQAEGLRRRMNDVPIEMHGALAPGEEPISDPLEILSTAERAIGWQTPIHATTPMPGGEFEVTNPESSWVIEKEQEEAPPVPEKDDDVDGITVRDWAYQAGFTSDGRAKGKEKVIEERPIGRSVESRVTDVSGGDEAKGKEEDVRL